MTRGMLTLCGLASLWLTLLASAEQATPETLEEKVERLRADFAEHPDDQDLKFELAKASHFLGIAGDNAAGEQAEVMLLELTEARPDDPLITAYYGSARLMAAKRTWVIWDKGKIAQEGILLLNQAVKDDPDNSEIRFLRGASTYHLPGFFKMAEQSEGDFAFVVATALEDVEAGRLSPELAAAAFYHQGLILEDHGKVEEAVEAWTIAVELAPHSGAGRDAQAELDKRQ